VAGPRGLLADAGGWEMDPTSRILSSYSLTGDVAGDMPPCSAAGRPDRPDRSSPVRAAYPPRGGPIVGGPDSDVASGIIGPLPPACRTGGGSLADSGGMVDRSTARRCWGSTRHAVEKN
jgi:hypothetical protein